MCIDNPCKTKICCTIGPASSSLDILSDLVNSGMSMARLNLSYCDHKVALTLVDSLCLLFLNNIYSSFVKL